MQAWEALDPPSGWDCSSPVLASGFYQVSAAVLEVAQIMDDALSDAVASGEGAGWVGWGWGMRRSGWQRLGAVMLRGGHP